MWKNTIASRSNPNEPQDGNYCVRILQDDKISAPVDYWLMYIIYNDVPTLTRF